MNMFIGLIIPPVIYLIITILHLIIPGRWYTGYVNNEQTGQKLRYRLNGIFVLFASVGTWAYVAPKFNALIWLYTHRWSSIISAVIIGLLYSAYMVFSTKPVSNNVLKDYYLGRKLNPQFKNGYLDHKMLLYLIGAVMLVLNVLSAAVSHFDSFSLNGNNGIYLCMFMIIWFVMDYLIFEHVHLYTYDIFAERIGFKLGWGCLSFYPYFYAIAIWSTVDLPDPGMQSWQFILSLILFFGGWMLARGANLQKYYFKRNPDKKFLWIKPQYISDGDRKLLVNGFWGLSRHINYLGEILMGLGIATSVGHYGIIWPWLYPLYYVLLLVPRQIDDDKRCAKKYGPLWDEYVNKVKSRIIPKIY